MGVPNKDLKWAVRGMGPICAEPKTRVPKGEMR